MCLKGSEATILSPWRCFIKIPFILERPWVNWWIFTVTEQRLHREQQNPTCWGGRVAPSQVAPRPGCARSVQPPPCLSCWTQPCAPPAPGSEQTHQCQPLSAWQSQGYTRTNLVCCGALCNAQTKVGLPTLSYSLIPRPPPPPVWEWGYSILVIVDIYIVWHFVHLPVEPI